MKDFSDIKIPRKVEKKNNIKKIKESLAKIIDIKDLKIQFGNGSGKGGSSINAIETAKQENATKFCAETFIETGKFPTGNSIEKIYNGYDDFMNKFESTASINIGSQVQPLNYEDACFCS